MHLKKALLLCNYRLMVHFYPQTEFPMRLLLTALLTLPLLALAPLEAVKADYHIWSKCRTANGNDIVVKGSRCPAGTIYVGPG
jgi:hypothetical protein